MINKDIFINEIQKLENSWGSLSIKDIDNIQIVKSPSNIIFLGQASLYFASILLKAFILSYIPFL